MLSSKSPFLSGRAASGPDSRAHFAKSGSDLLSSFNAYQGWKKARASGIVQQYCHRHNVSDTAFAQIEDQKIQLAINLVDANLLAFDASEQSRITQFRVTGNRKVFFEIPSRFDEFANDELICTIIAMSFYPNILLREGQGHRNVYSNQTVKVGGSSIVQSNNKPPKWLCYYEAMQARSGNLNVFEVSRIPEQCLPLVLGEGKFRIFAGVIIVDNGRMRFALRHWRQVIALKVLRESFFATLDHCYRTPRLQLSRDDQFVIELVASALTGSKSSQTLM